MTLYDELSEYQLRCLENEFLGLTTATLTKVKRVAERKTRSYYRGGWHGLAERERDLAGRIVNELRRREEEFQSKNYDEWGTFVGDPADNPEAKKKSWWKTLLGLDKG